MPVSNMHNISGKPFMYREKSKRVISIHGLIVIGFDSCGFDSHF